MADALSLTTSTHALRDAAAWLATAIERTLRAKPVALVAIPGGSAAAVVGEARKNLASSLLSRVRWTWVDERCVPVSDPESNRGVAHRKNWIDEESARTELALYLDDETPEQACARVSGELHRKHSDSIDIALLGLGEDGHVASLFPAHAALREKHASVVSIHDSPKPPPRRISLTLRLLDTANTKIVYAVGEGKRTALQRTLAKDASYPLTQLRDVRIITDLDMGEHR